jgi:hypothetical protein
MDGGVNERVGGMGQLVVDGFPEAVLIGAYHFGPAVDDDLGGIDAVEHEDFPILFLTLGKVGPAEGVFPAHAVPVIYVKTKDIDAGGVGLWKGGYELVGGGTAGAAFGSEEFDDCKPFVMCGRLIRNKQKGENDQF